MSTSFLAQQAQETVAWGPKISTALGWYGVMILAKAIGQRIDPSTKGGISISKSIWDKVFDGLVIVLAIAFGIAVGAIPNFKTAMEWFGGVLGVAGGSIVSIILAVFSVYCAYAFAKDDESKSAWRWLALFVVTVSLALRIAPQEVLNITNWLSDNITGNAGSWFVKVGNGLGGE